LIIACAAVGVAGAIAAANYAAAGRDKVLEQIGRLGTNVITVAAKQSSAVGGRARTGNIVTTLTEADYVAMQRELPQVERHSALVSAPLRLKAAGQSKIAPVVGCEPDYFAIRNWLPASGEPFDAMQLRRAARVAVLGATLARDLYGDADPLGEVLTINRIPFEIIAVMHERGPGLDAVNEDQQVYVPLSAAMRRVLNIDYYSSIVLQIARFEAMDDTTRTLTDLLRGRHQAPAGRSEDFTVQNQKALIDTQLSSARELAFFVRWIALSTLLVAGLGVLAMAWIAVRDRRREIGTRRALGATTRDVFIQFCYESLLLAGLGVVCGLVLGLLASRWITAAADLPYVFDTGSAALALASALVVNLLAGAAPALRAARLDPIAALRHD
jgi:ABC-type antimicrobial peptide transport system permease subunit